MSNSNTAVAQHAQSNDRPSIAKVKAVLESQDFRNAVAKALPSHITPERFIRVAITATMRNAKLLECTQASLLKCFLDMAAYGIEPDGRRAHLIPYENSKKVGDRWVKELECTLQLDWKGIAELVMRSGIVSYLHADVIRSGDLFVYSKGELKDHVPWYLRSDESKPHSEGDRIGAYALARMKDGTELCVHIPASDIIAIRNKSQGWIAFQKGYAKQSPWNPVDPHIESEMWKKTAFKRLSKWMPLSPEIIDAVNGDDDVIDIDPQNVRRVEAGNDGLANALEDMLAKSAAEHQPVGIEEHHPTVLDTTVVEEREKVPVQATQEQPAKAAAKSKNDENPADALVQESLAATDPKQVDDIIRRAGALETEQQRMKVYLACDAKKKEIASGAR